MQIFLGGDTIFLFLGSGTRENNLLINLLHSRRRVGGRLRRRVQRIHRGDVRRVAERLPAPPHPHAQWTRRVGNESRLLPPQPSTLIPPEHESTKVCRTVQLINIP